jgi:hypothetical protein
MKSILTIGKIALVVCLFTACNNLSKPAEHIKTPEELRQELKQNEQGNPLGYVGSHNENLKPNVVMIREGGLFRDAQYETQGDILSGSIKNSASVATFKDAVLKVSYISETNTVISSEQFTIYKVFAPGSDIAYGDIKTNPPAEMKSYNVQVIGATAIN